MNNNIKVACIGQLVADIVVRPVDALPIAGRTDSVEELCLLAGGCAANTASVLAKLGADASVVGLIGNDSMGDAVLADLASSGVDTTKVSRNDEVTTSSVIVVVQSNGERSFLYRCGGNEALSSDFIPDNVIKDAGILHVGGAMKLTTLDLSCLLKRAKSMDCITSLDTDWDVHGRWMSKLETALPMVDFFLTNQEEGRMLTGYEYPEDIGTFLLSKGPKTVVVKRGALGAVVVTRDGMLDFPTYEVPVVDTTCAGDSFVAGLLFGVSRGWGIEESVKLANAAGALCTTQISHHGIRSLTETMTFLARQA